MPKILLPLLGGRSPSCLDRLAVSAKTPAELVLFRRALHRSWLRARVYMLSDSALLPSFPLLSLLPTPTFPRLPLPH